MGISRDHVNLDFVYGYRINKHFDIGIGTGIDHNVFYFYTINDLHFVNIVGAPLYIQGKYNDIHINLYCILDLLYSNELMIYSYVNLIKKV